MNTPASPADTSLPPQETRPVDLQTLAGRVRESLQEAERHAGRLGKTSGILNLTGITASAATTAFTGWTSVSGPMFGDTVGAWRLTCIIAALLGFLTTIVMAVSQQQRYSDRLARANECLGRLKSLDFSLLAQNKNPQDLLDEYAAILRQYPEELK